jgi:hypothetical protein
MRLAQASTIALFLLTATPADRLPLTPKRCHGGLRGMGCCVQQRRREGRRRRIPAEREAAAIAVLGAAIITRVENRRR